MRAVSYLGPSRVRAARVQRGRGRGRAHALYLAAAGVVSAVGATATTASGAGGVGGAGAPQAQSFGFYDGLGGGQPDFGFYAGFTTPR